MNRSVSLNNLLAASTVAIAGISASFASETPTAKFHRGGILSGSEPGELNPCRQKVLGMPGCSVGDFCRRERPAMIEGDESLEVLPYGSFGKLLPKAPPNLRNNKGPRVSPKLPSNELRRFPPDLLEKGFKRPAENSQSGSEAGKQTKPAAQSEP